MVPIPQRVGEREIRTARPCEYKWHKTRVKKKSSSNANFLRDASLRREGRAFVPCHRVPELGGAVGAATGHDVACAEGDARDQAFVPRQRRPRFTRAQVPQLDRSVIAPRRQRVAVTRNGHRIDSVRMTLE